MTTNPQPLQQLHRVDFLFKAGHGMLFNVPSLSRYYMNEYHDTLKEYELTPQKHLKRIACKKCGQIRLPGLNTTVELKKYKKNKNKLYTTCKSCCNTTVYSGSNKKKIPLKITSQPLKNDIPTPSAAPPVTEKKKKNKGKKNSLKALLNKSNTTTSSHSSGGLGDFLSSL